MNSLEPDQRTTKRAIAYDDLLVHHVGEFSRYQKYIYFGVCMIAIPAAFNNMGIVFIAGTPEHWCREPQLDRLNLSESQVKNLSIPTDAKGAYESCTVYDRNYTGWGEEEAIECLASNCNVNTSTTRCDSGWLFSREEFISTAVSQFNMVCDHRWLQATAKSVFMAGLMIGVIVFGSLSDQVGRFPIFVMSSTFMVLTSILQAFSPNITAFLIIRFLVGAFTITVYTTGFVIALEMVGPSYRVQTGVAYQYFWSFGYMSYAGLAYLLRDWKTLQLVTTVPATVIFFLFFIVPESPRWMYVKNKAAKAEEIMRKMASVNKTEFPDSYYIKVEEKSQGYIWDLIRTPNMRLKTVVLCYTWFVNSLVYYGLSLNSSELGGNCYINFFIMGAVEVPAYVFTQIALLYLGRRWTLSIVMILGGISLLCILPVPSELNNLAIAFAMAGKCGISASFALIYVFTAEIYPTTIRNIGVSTGSFWARLAGVLAPYFGELSHIGWWVPLVIFGVLSLSAGLLIWLLPETKGKKLPETIEDGEKFGRKQMNSNERTLIPMETNIN